MKRRLMFFGVLLLTSLILLILPLKAEIPKDKNEITCEDGDKFIIEESGIRETTHSPGSKDDLIIIDSRNLRLTFYRNGLPFRIYPVAIGESETPTPIGEWKVIHKGGKWGDGFGERWIGINVPWGIYGIHGTNKPWSIGTRASHGCVRMFNKHVLELYGLIKLGTPVHIVGDLPKISPRAEIERNNTGRDVVAFQFALRKAGFEPGIADGRFGTEMEQAVYKLQFYYGLRPSGKIGRNEQLILGIPLQQSNSN